MIATASSLERVLQCPGSTKLVQIRATSEASAKGTGKHRYLELVANGETPEAALDQVPPEFRAVCAALPIDDLPTSLAAEVALALDLADGRAWEIGRGLDRAYGDDLPVFSIAGTADVIGIGDDFVYVADWKGPGNRTRARDSVQLRFLALAACRVYGKSRARVERIRLGDDGEAWRDHHDYDDLDLDAFELELRERLTAGPWTAIHEGAWCDYCPAMAHCPAKARLAVQLAEGRIIEAPGEMLPLTPERAGLAWGRLRAAKKLLTHIEAAVMATLEENGGSLPLPDGRVLRRVSRPGNERLDGEKVFHAMAELFGAEVAEKAVEMTATKGAIKDALRPIATKRGELGRAEAAVLDKVRAAGGATRKPTTSLEEVDA